MSCPTGKKTYPTARLAALALRGVTRRTPGVAAFRCALCAGWHLGRGRPARERVRRERQEKRAEETAHRQVVAATGRRGR